MYKMMTLLIFQVAKLRNISQEIDRQPFRNLGGNALVLFT